MSRFGMRLRVGQPVGSWLRTGVRIKSIQRSTVTITSGNVTSTAPINAVDMTQSVLSYLGCTFSTNDLGWASATARLSFTNPTTITATRVGSSGAGSVIVGFEVIEYEPGSLKQVQRDTVTTGGTKNVSSVDIGKATLSYLGWSCVDVTTGANQTVETPRLSLASATSVAASNGNGDANTTVGFQLTEWY